MISYGCFKYLCAVLILLQTDPSRAKNVTLIIDASCNFPNLYEPTEDLTYYVEWSGADPGEEGCPLYFHSSHGRIVISRISFYMQNDRIYLDYTHDDDHTRYYSGNEPPKTWTGESDTRVEIELNADENATYPNIRVDTSSSYFVLKVTYKDEDHALIIIIIIVVVLVVFITYVVIIVVCVCRSKGRCGGKKNHVGHIIQANKCQGGSHGLVIQNTNSRVVDYPIQPKTARNANQITPSYLRSPANEQSTGLRTLNDPWPPSTGLNANPHPPSYPLPPLTGVAHHQSTSDQNGIPPAAVYNPPFGSRY